MPSRKDLKKQKEKTSQALILAGLELCADEGYASLSLRSVARKAGIAPTSFYRHFREIDEMGVEMIAQAKEVLDEFIDKARKKMTFPAAGKSDTAADPEKAIECVTRPFVDAFFNVMGKNNHLVHLFFQEKTGSSKAMRDAVLNASEQLTGDLADTLTMLFKASSLMADDIRLIAEAMLTIVSAGGMEMRVHPEAKTGDISAKAVRKLNLLLQGALCSAACCSI